MPFYQQRGEIPRKRHVVFKKTTSPQIEGNLYFEELISREGFSSHYSNLYHLSMPTRVKRVGKFTPIELRKAESDHRPRHLKTFEVKPSEDWVMGRRPMLFNSDVVISKLHCQVGKGCARAESFYRNGHGDELIYVQRGSGILASQFGELRFGPGDYLVVPRGVIVSWRQSTDEVRALVIESPTPIETPRRYRSRFGQLLEHSPFCERDIRTPVLAPPRDEAGEFLIRVKLTEGIQEYTLANHPFDVKGWDGFLFPWAFNIKDFEPIVGRIHQPPPIHQTFETQGFVVCSFVTRPFDFHPEAIPAPYPHSNVDSDEVLFYSAGEFMSRKGIFEESISFHPMGIPHGPQPGRYEASIGKKETEELAVMVDTFKPLHLAHEALVVDDARYALSWIED